MRRNKTITIIMGVIVLGVTLLGFSYFIQEPDKSIADPSTNKQADKEHVDQTTEKKNSKDTEDEKNQETEDSLQDEIKNTVTRVAEGAVDLFVKKDLNITAIGDSLTQGVGDSQKNGGYVGILENSLEKNNKNIAIENWGKRGNRSDQLLERLEKEEIQSSIKQSDIILVTVGANDIMKIAKESFPNLTYEPFVQEQVEYKKRLRKIVDNMMKTNEDAEIYLIGFYNPFEKFFSNINELGLIVENWNDTGKSVADEYDQVNYIPIIDLFQNTDENVFYKDNFHPNDKGYQLMAERVLEYIRPSIEREN